MRISRRFTEVGKSPYAAIEFRQATSEIKKPDGSLVFQQHDIEVPADWSQVACDVLAQKYFRKRGVPVKLKAVVEPDVPTWLWRAEPDTQALGALPEKGREAGERMQEVAGNMKGALDSSVKDQPMVTLAMAAVVGFVLGALWKS